LTSDVAAALEAARIYRGLGLVPLPSRTDDKRPDLPSYSQYRTESVPAEIYTEAAWRVPNVQLMCGVKTQGKRKIVVIDCDGDLAHETFLRMCADNGFKPDTWVCRTGSGGRHYYFTPPPALDSLPTKLLWGLWDTYGRQGKGDWVKHTEIKLLGDGSLCVAPPSRHVSAGFCYHWLDSRRIRLSNAPQSLPRWLLASDAAVPLRSRQADSEAPPIVVRHGSKAWTRREVLDGIADKIALAQSWGLRVTGSVNGCGWVACRCPGREDRRPSGSIRVASGTFVDWRHGATYNFFDLGVLLGRFADAESCIHACATQFLGRPVHPTEKR
jgi:hypothetical protein